MWIDDNRNKVHKRNYAIACLSRLVLPLVILSVVLLIGCSTNTASRSPLQFVPVAACRIMDTRIGSTFTDVFGPPSLSAKTTRSVPILSAHCGIPSSAQGYSLNLTAVPKAASLGYVTLWPNGMPQPAVSTLNSADGKILANAAIVYAGTGGAINLFVTDTADVVLDIDGYFTPPNGESLEFYPLVPCRVIDNPNGPFGGPSLSRMTRRDLAMRENSCGIPPMARAYSLNITALPKGPLGYLTVWPTGRPQPVPSTLSSPTGIPVANAAIVQGGTNGSLSIYATDNAGLIVDINGYFAPPGPGGLNFYLVPPCRIADTRDPAGGLGGGILSTNEVRTIPVLQSTCDIPGTARAYSLNITAVPAGPLALLSVWPSGVPRPGTVTLTDHNGLPLSNAAITPAGIKGAVNIFASHPTHVVIDVNGYFAQ